VRWLEIAVGADVAAIVATAVLFEPAASLVIPPAAIAMGVAASRVDALGLGGAKI